LTKLVSALGETIVAGPKTNVAFLKKLCEAEGFRAGHFDTGFIDRNLDALIGGSDCAADFVAAAGAFELALDELARADACRRRISPFDNPGRTTTSPTHFDAFRLVGERGRGFRIVVDGKPAEAVLNFTDRPEITAALTTIRHPTSWTTTEGGGFFFDDRYASPYQRKELGITVVPVDEGKAGYIILHEGRQTRVSLYDPFDVDLEHMDQGGSVKAPMHGKLIAVFVKAGDKVEKGQRLAIVEAMKMEHVLVAPADGEVAEIAAEPGAQVAEGARLIGLKTEG
jgi:3-methylcrotonyl-CoA carboxylase alpha subunit